MLHITNLLLLRYLLAAAASRVLRFFGSRLVSKNLLRLHSCSTPAFTTSLLNRLTSVSSGSLSSGASFTLQYTFLKSNLLFCGTPFSNILSSRTGSPDTAGMFAFVSTRYRTDKVLAVLTGARGCPSLSDTSGAHARRSECGRSWRDGGEEEEEEGEERERWWRCRGHGTGASELQLVVYRDRTNGLAKLRVDSSALDRLAACRSSPSAAHQISFPSQFTPEESRASLTVLLNRLLLSGASSTRTVIPVLFSTSLNSRESLLDLGPLSVTDEELSILERSEANLIGVCALLDYQSTLLSTVVDAVAALSCEAIKADVSSFNSVDAGDVFTSKDEIGVSSDMKVLLNGSKLVGKVEVEAVHSILKIHATLRKVVKSVHLEMRANLNSVVKVGKAGSWRDGAVEAGATALLPLASALQNVGESSLLRTKMNLDLITAEKKSEEEEEEGGLGEGNCCCGAAD
ncbi:hypothetical protein CRG98_012949 [Punica granatum]|uniref:Uncharacterized protein n=1 Tax=Punica granatum TaxID=22663 RepID=A0A2I0KDL9_PUNGR|nr:hypothetical protein CRG98_012949 [Punica granatum]